MTPLDSKPQAAGARIVGVGHYQPERIVTNDEIAARIDTSDEWIVSRVGIKQRRIAGDDETVADMAFTAATRAITNAELKPSDIDLVVVATFTPESPVPNQSAQVAARLGLTAGAFDVNTACSGFCYGLATAHHAIRSGSARNAVVVGTEKISSWMDWNDRSTAVIFADGAGAAVVSASDYEGIGPVVWGTDGEKASLIQIADRTDFLRQEGQSVFRWATSAVAPVALQACEAAGVKPGDLAAFVPHQANGRIIDAIARKLGLEDAVIAKDIVESGNTSAASIPLALSKLVEAGRIPSGAPVLLFGFGAGLTYAGQVVLAP